MKQNRILNPVDPGDVPRLRLYAVVLGGRLAGTRVGEDHETVFVVAENEVQARAKAKDKWSGITRAGLHVDALACLEQVDGYAVKLETASESGRARSEPLE